MGCVKHQPRLSHRDSGGRRFGFSLGGQRDVMPSGKEIALVPGTLTVAQYDEISKHNAIVGPHCRLSLNLSGSVVGSANL